MMHFASYLWTFSFRLGKIKFGHYFQPDPVCSKRSFIIKINIWIIIVQVGFKEIRFTNVHGI